MGEGRPMKPITADSHEGRFLLALRAGRLTCGEISERLGNCSGVTSLTRLGFIQQIDGYYLITEAGRAACPYRNPKAAPGIVPPAIFKSEIEMSRETVVTRQQVLAVVKEAGSAGISKLDLVAKFEHLVNEAAITSHLVMLKKDGAVSNPNRGVWLATSVNTEPVRPVAETKVGSADYVTVMAWLGKQPKDYGVVPSEIAKDIGCTEESTRAVLAGLYAGMKVDRRKVGNDWAYYIDRPDAQQPQSTASVAGQLIAAQQLTLAEKITKVLMESDAALSAKEISARVEFPPDSETLTREIYFMKADGRLYNDPLAERPAGSRGNVGMYRLASSQLVDKKDDRPMTVVIAPVVSDHEHAPAVAETTIDRSPPDLVESQAKLAKATNSSGIFAVFVEDADEFEVGIFSDGTMTLVMEDGLGDATVELCPAAVKKLRAFLGLFSEAV
jgi:hypothetical protein